MNERTSESPATYASYLTSVGGRWGPDTHSYQHETLQVTHVTGDTLGNDKESDQGSNPGFRASHRNPLQSLWETGITVVPTPSRGCCED